MFGLIKVFNTTIYARASEPPMLQNNHQVCLGLQTCTFFECTSTVHLQYSTSLDMQYTFQKCTRDTKLMQVHFSVHCTCIKYQCENVQMYFLLYKVSKPKCANHDLLLKLIDCSNHYNNWWAYDRRFILMKVESLQFFVLLSHK